jgi:hypothetical protein
MYNVLDFHSGFFFAAFFFFFLLSRTLFATLRRSLVETRLLVSAVLSATAKDEI